MNKAEKSIVCSGKTVQDALDRALEALQVRYEQTEIEVIEAETKGVLGVGAKPAVIRVTVKAASPAADPDAGENEADGASADPARLRDGQAQVAGGRIRISNGTARGPRVRPGANVKLWKNGTEIVEFAEVREGDRVEATAEDEIREPAWDVEISEDGLEARLLVEPGYRTERKLKDLEPSDDLTVVAEESVVPIPLDPKAVIRRLQELRVEYGLDYAALNEACGATEKGAFVIAKGLPVTPGTPGSFESVRDLEVKKGLKEREDGSVDYREIKEIPSVSPGEVLGTLRQPLPGEPGMTVTKEPIPPDDYVPLRVLDGKGVVWIDNDTRAVAAEAGQPIVKVGKGSIQLTIVPKLTISSDVNLQVGNVRFRGDVEVGGSVQDQMLAEAQGSILVRGNVHSAKLKAGRSIIVSRNVIASELTAGTGSFAVAEVRQSIGEILPILGQLEQAMVQLQAVPDFQTSTLARTGFGPVVQMLLESRFKSVAAGLRETIRRMDEVSEELDPDGIEIARRLSKALLAPQSPGIACAEDFSGLVELARRWQSEPEEPDSDCFIRTGFVQNSTLYCGGGIFVGNPGLYQSRLQARGKIVVEGTVRGGELHSRRDITLEEVGSKGTVPTVLSVPAAGRIRIARVLENTVLRVGPVTHTFLQAATGVDARLGPGGALLLHG